MIVTAVIEMPRGDDRRRHLNKFNKKEFIDLGPMKEHIPVNDGIQPEHYGYIENTHNGADDDELDVILFTNKRYQTGDRVSVRPIALLDREDGDGKIIAVEPDDISIKWSDIERARRELVLSFFSSHHRITSVRDAAATERFLHASMTK